ncbi:hypothetical protein AB0F68_06915 [Micromonospora sp. NPDC023966]|uniref:hypothetical protein n=1 Tax=Micromonospora sp. NPDC023966 TaxID=3154699 RepID=UPI00340AE4B5
MSIVLAFPAASPLAITAFGFSVFVQSWRRRIKPLSTLRVGQKNAGKAAGMVAAALFAAPAVLVVCVVVALAAGTAFLPHGPVPPVALGEAAAAPATGFPDLLLWTEALHHAHYFAYCYVFWSLTTLEPALVGPLFIMGWVFYFALEASLRGRRRLFRPVWFVLGHVLCAAALAAITAVNDNLLVLAMWVITGIGGGSAYMLGNVPAIGDRELFEDSGHVLGCLVCVAAVALTGSAAAATAAGATLAVLAAVTMHLSMRGRRT